MKQQNPSILLINPWIYDFASFDLWAKPLGLLYLAGLLRFAGYEVTLIDCLDIYYPGLDKEIGLKRGARQKYGTGTFYSQRVPKPSFFPDIPRFYYRFGMSQKLFLEALESTRNPTAILVTSGMTYWYPGVFEAIRLCKQRWPGVPVILGGIYATLCHEHAVSFSGADFFIKGPAEEKILPLLQDITGFQPQVSPDVSCLDKLPYPAFDLLSDIDYVCLLTSRGCAFSCSYCASSLLQSGFVQRCSEGVVQEIIYWHGRYAIKDFAFYDDALLVNREEHIIPILKDIISHGLEISFHSPNGLHARYIDASLAGLMYRAGFKRLHLGLETTSDNRLDGKVTVEEFVQAVSYLKEAGFENEHIACYLLIGLPHQDPGEAEHAISLALKHGVKARLAEYSPIPGTGLWKEAVFCSRYDLAEEPLTHNNSVMPCLGGSFTWSDVKRLKELLQKQ